MLRAKWKSAKPIAQGKSMVSVVQQTMEMPMGEILDFGNFIVSKHPNEFPLFIDIEPMNSQADGIQQMSWECLVFFKKTEFDYNKVSEEGRLSFDFRMDMEEFHEKVSLLHSSYMGRHPPVSEYTDSELNFPHRCTWPTSVRAHGQILDHTETKLMNDWNTRLLVWADRKAFPVHSPKRKGLPGISKNVSEGRLSTRWTPSKVVEDWTPMKNAVATITSWRDERPERSKSSSIVSEDSSLGAADAQNVQPAAAISPVKEERIEIKYSAPRTPMQQMRRNFLISDCFTVTEERMHYLNEHEWIQHDGVFVMHIDVLRTIKVASDYDHVGDAALHWMSRKMNNGLPVTKVSVEIQTLVQKMDREKLRLLYILTQNREDFVPDTTCRRCGDVDSHVTERCVRFPSLQSRYAVLGENCKGCERDDCRLGNTPHARWFLDACTDCENYKGAKTNSSHTKFLCPDTITWMKFRLFYLHICALARATQTWTLHDLIQLQEFHGEYVLHNWYIYFRVDGIR